MEWLPCGEGPLCPCTLLMKATVSSELPKDRFHGGLVSPTRIFHWGPYSLCTYICIAWCGVLNCAMKAKGQSGTFWYIIPQTVLYWRIYLGVVEILLVVWCRCELSNNNVVTLLWTEHSRIVWHQVWLRTSFPCASWLVKMKGRGRVGWFESVVCSTLQTNNIWFQWTLAINIIKLPKLGWACVYMPQCGMAMLTCG